MSIETNYSEAPLDIIGEEIKGFHNEMLSGFKNSLENEDEFNAREKVNRKDWKQIDRDYEELWNSMPEEYTKESGGLNLLFKKYEGENGEKTMELRRVEKDGSEPLLPFELKLIKKDGERGEYEVQYREASVSGEKKINGRSYGDIEDDNETPILPEDVSNYIGRVFKEMLG